MNDRVPDSSGLPLRAMVMVLLFFGVIFLLVGFQAMSSGGGDHESSGTSVATPTATTTTTTTSTKPPVPEVDVQVYNISEEDNLAEETADRLRDGGWNVTETGNLILLDVDRTTVYYDPEADGERGAAEAVGKLLDAPVEPRIDDEDITDKPPGVIVVVHD